MADIDGGVYGKVGESGESLPAGFVSNFKVNKVQYMFAFCSAQDEMIVIVVVTRKLQCEAYQPHLRLCELSFLPCLRKLLFLSVM